MPDTILPEIYSVHEAADVYPMILGDELQQLADDIKANGQLEPIIFTTDPDGEPVLVDGRNRLAACGMAEVQPVIEWRDFADDKSIRVYILSKNENRRHMNAGQRTMCVAVIRPDAMSKSDAAKAGKNKHLKKLSASEHVQLRNARFIIEWNAKEVEDVISGATRFSTAFDNAKTNRDVSTSGAAQMASLSDELRNLVLEGDLDLTEALAADKERKRTEKINRGTSMTILWELAKNAGAFSNAKGRAHFWSMLNDYEEEYPRAAGGMTTDTCVERIDELIENLTKFTAEKPDESEEETSN